MKIAYGLVGASGFGSEIMPLILEQNQSLQDNGSLIDCFFIDDNKQGNILNDVKVISEQEFCALDYDKLLFNVAIGDSKIRQKVCERLLNMGCTPFDVMSKFSRILHNSKIGEGSILTDFSIVTSNALIGKFFHSNLYSYIAHNCIVGDYVTLAPGVKVNGNVHIEDHVYIGTGAIIKQGTPDKPRIIGRESIIGMGAVVTKDVNAGSTVIGNPAKVMVK